LRHRYTSRTTTGHGSTGLIATRKRISDDFNASYLVRPNGIARAVVVMNPARIVIAPDSFKGSATAREVAHAISDGLHSTLPTAGLTLAPMADGGEGTLDCVAAAIDGRLHHLELKGIHGEPVEAAWFRTHADLAVIESATVLGLPLIETQSEPPALDDRGSYALGELILAALDAGCRDLAIGLGGSASNDAGLGMLMALGAVARDGDGLPVAPTMSGLLATRALDLDDLDPRLDQARITALCDVDNPLLGDNGASRVYGPQKGLTDADIDAVAAAFKRIAACCGSRGDTTAAGSGAAGGLGFAVAVLGGRLASGANTLMDMTGLHARLAEADLVITGEGRSDRQTISGKLPLAIARAALPTPTLLVSGAIADDARDELSRYFSAAYTLVEQAGSLDAARGEPLRWLREIAARIGRQHAETKE